MMVKCSHSDCSKEADFICSCKKNVLFCGFHYVYHKKVAGVHEEALVSDRLDEIRFKACEASKKMKEIREKTIQKAENSIKDILSNLMALESSLTEGFMAVRKILENTDLSDSLEIEIEKLEGVYKQCQSFIDSDLNKKPSAESKLEINDLTRDLGSGEMKPKQSLNVEKIHSVKVFQIFFLNFSGRTITLEVNSSDTIGTVKSKIQEKDLIPANQFRIFFRGNLLDDEKTISHYNITKSPTLTLKINNSYRKILAVKLIDSNEEFIVDISDMDYIYNLKAKIEEITNIPFVSQKLRMPLVSQKLKYGEILKDDCLLDSCKITSGSHIQLSCKEFEINVKMMNKGSVFELKVRPTDDIESVKTKIQTLKGISCQKQFLYVLEVELLNSKKLLDYKIVPSTELLLKTAN